MPGCDETSGERSTTTGAKGGKGRRTEDCAIPGGAGCLSPWNAYHDLPARGVPESNISFTTQNDGIVPGAVSTVSFPFMHMRRAMTPAKSATSQLNCMMAEVTCTAMPPGQASTAGATGTEQRAVGHDETMGAGMKSIASDSRSIAGNAGSRCIAIH